MRSLLLDLRRTPRSNHYILIESQPATTCTTQDRLLPAMAALFDFSGLQYELKFRVLTFIHPKREQAALCRVSKEFRNLIAPILWEASSCCTKCI
jgi:hypothetical protein